MVIINHVFENHVNVATTVQFVKVAGLYETVAVGTVLSIRSTIAITYQEFPRASTKVNMKLPLSVKV